MTRLADWQPRSQLRAPATPVHRATTPVIDVHNHLGRWLSDDGTWLVSDVSSLLRLMDDVGVRVLVNLDGRWGTELNENLERYDRAHPDRFLSFCHVDWSLLSEDDGTVAVVATLQAQLEASAKAGARGVKVWKDLGLTVRDASGVRVMPDDDRVVTLLRTAGDLGLPVLIHTADPVAFFDPLDDTNERIDELIRVPQWWFGGDEYPTFSELIESLDRLIGDCPQTTFIGAHVGCWAEDLVGVGRMLNSHSNWHVDLGGRLGEIGRQPRAFARFVEDFPSRVLFGTDAFPPSRDAYERCYRFLQTSDEHFAYSDEVPPPQGRWQIYGCELPQERLEAIYSGNARRVLGLP